MSHNKIDEDKIAQNLKAIMEKAELTPTQLSRITGVPRTTLIGIIDGKTEKMYWSTLYKISKTLDCSMEELIEGPKSPPEMQQVVEKIADHIKEDLEIIMISELSKLPQFKANRLARSSAEKILQRTKKRLKKISEGEQSSSTPIDSEEKS